MASRQGLARCLPTWRSAPPHTANASSGTNAAGIARCSRQRIAIGRRVALASIDAVTTRWA